MKVGEAGVIHVDTVHGGVVVEGGHTAIDYQVGVHWAAQDVMQNEGFESGSEVLQKQDIPYISISVHYLQSFQ